MILQEFLAVNKLRSKLQAMAEQDLLQNPSFQRLQTLPGIGPILALTILAEAGDLRRFSSHRRFLKFCGLDLATHQSGSRRGQTRLSKRGNSRLRHAFWLAATVAIRQRENSFRSKYENYIRQDPKNADLKRKAYTAVAAKLARVCYALIKYQTDYRCYFEAAIPGGKIPLSRAVGAAR
jgi:transposase